MTCCRMATYEAALAAKDMGISLLTLTEGKPSYYNMRELHGKPHNAAYVDSIRPNNFSDSGCAGSDLKSV